MRDWDAYARVNPLDSAAYQVEPVQHARAQVIADRVSGTVLDVGAGDGYVADLIRENGHWVKTVDISPIRVDRCRGQHLPAVRADACDLPFEDGAYETVVLGELLEHLDNPGDALSEACRVARKRVVVSLPLNGWADPTHEWRVRLDLVRDDAQHLKDPTKGEQIVLTFERGVCWPKDYFRSDPSWAELFEAD